MNVLSQGTLETLIHDSLIEYPDYTTITVVLHPYSEQNHINNVCKIITNILQTVYDDPVQIFNVNYSFVEKSGNNIYRDDLVSARGITLNASYLRRQQQELMCQVLEGRNAKSLFSIQVTVGDTDSWHSGDDPLYDVTSPPSWKAISLSNIILSEKIGISGLFSVYKLARLNKK